jgi:large subunit ribosomal protein L21
MYAVVNSGGKQYKVQQGDLLRVEKLCGDVGSPVTFDRVMMYSDGESVSVGQPLLDSVAVEGHIVEQGKARKIIVFKYKRRKRFRRKNGHRQEFTAVLIDSIKAKGTKTAKAAEAEAAAEAKPEAEAAAEAKPEAEAAAEAKPEAEAAAEAKPEAEAAAEAKPEAVAEAKPAEAQEAAPKKEVAKETAAKKAAPEKEAEE